MINQIKIRNLVLIEEAHISFEHGLNVLTGETGAGKSAILHALSLIRGEKVDISILRKGADKGSVEALFSINECPLVAHLLEESGIDHLDSDGSEILLKREILANGRSRAFINNQIAQAALLERIGELLFEIIGQHANQSLRTPEQHRGLLDLYGENTPLYVEYRESWSEKSKLQQELDALVSKEAERIRTIEICEIEIEEIEEAKLQEEEDDTLFQEYTLLCSAEERASKLDEALSALQGERGSVLPQLHRCEQLAKELVAMDADLGEVSTTLHSAFIELEEALYTLRDYRHRIDINPERISKLDERLSHINKLKRKYGTTVAEIQAYCNEQKEKASRLKNADQRIEDLKEVVKNEKGKLARACESIVASKKSCGSLNGNGIDRTTTPAEYAKSCVSSRTLPSHAWTSRSRENRIFPCSQRRREVHAHPRMC